jgi:peptide-methionine (S)-S-oxide reductase
LQKSLIVYCIALLCSFVIAGQSSGARIDMKLKNSPIPFEEITVGAGCFWCTEAIFEEVKGVEKVESGYAGGSTIKPTYEDVCSGKTGHAEVIQITFNPAVISLEKILQIFFATHDPTTLNRQGADTGTQYRSIVFYRNEWQKNVINKVIDELKKLKAYKDPIVTEVVPYSVFYRAEDYHQDYYRNNKEQGYCRIVINPKLNKFRQVFRDNLKK